MAISEQTVTGKKYRVWDETLAKWKRFSFWTKASDVELDDGTTAQAKITTMDTKLNGLINDTTASTTNTYSSSKVNSQIGALISDSSASTSKTYSSSKINTQISGLISDSSASTTKTYSSSKIAALVDGVNPSWTGTKAQWAAQDKSKIKAGQTVNITDDYTSSLTATGVQYDNTTSKISATSVQGAIDKVNSDLGGLKKPTLITTEHVVGTYNGKDIYERTWIGKGSFADGTTVDSTLSLSQIDTLLYLNGCFKRHDNVYLPLYYQIQVYISSKVALSIATGYPILEYSITARYTKK